jgi:hypothetical protein
MLPEKSGATALGFPGTYAGAAHVIHARLGEIPAILSIIYIIQIRMRQVSSPGSQKMLSERPKSPAAVRILRPQVCDQPLMCHPAPSEVERCTISIYFPGHG